jgi:hypothetical protein
MANRSPEHRQEVERCPGDCPAVDWTPCASHSEALLWEFWRIQVYQAHGAHLVNRTTGGESPRTFRHIREIHKNRAAVRRAMRGALKGLAP